MYRTSLPAISTASTMQGRGGKDAELDRKYEDQYKAQEELGNALAKERQGHDHVVGLRVLVHGAVDAGKDGDHKGKDEGRGHKDQGRPQVACDHRGDRLIALVGGAQVSVQGLREPAEVLDNDGVIEAPVLRLLRDGRLVDLGACADDLQRVPREGHDGVVDDRDAKEHRQGDQKALCDILSHLRPPLRGSSPQWDASRRQGAPAPRRGPVRAPAPCSCTSVSHRGSALQSGSPLEGRWQRAPRRPAP